MGWINISHLSVISTNIKKKKKPVAFTETGFHWCDFMVKIIFQTFDKNQNHLNLLRCFARLSNTHLKAFWYRRDRLLLQHLWLLWGGLEARFGRNEWPYLIICSINMNSRHCYWNVWLQCLPPWVHSLIAGIPEV